MDADLARHGDALGTIRGGVADGCDQLAGATSWLLASYERDAWIPGAVAHSLLMLTGTVAGGWQMARAAVAASDRLAGDAGDREFYEAKIITARFFAEQIMPTAAAYRRAIEYGSDTVMALSEDQF